MAVQGFSQEVDGHSTKFQLTETVKHTFEADITNFISNIGVQVHKSLSCYHSTLSIVLEGYQSPASQVILQEVVRVVCRRKLGLGIYRAQQWSKASTKDRRDLNVQLVSREEDRDHRE